MLVTKQSTAQTSLSPDLKDLDLKQMGVYWYCDVHDEISFLRYEVIRETPRGYWVQLRQPSYTGPTLWRKKGGRFLAPTRREALWRLWRRKQKHVRYARADLVKAETAFGLVDKTITAMGQLGR